MDSLPSHIQSKLQEMFAQFDLKEQYANLSNLYKTNKANPRLTEQMGIAYARGRMPATFSVIKNVLQKFYEKGLHFDSVLDIGAGPGTLKLALSEEVQYSAIEQSESMLKIFQTLHGNKNNVAKTSLQKFIKQQNYDAVFASYVINEIENKESCIKKIFELSSKYIFIIEPGTPVGFQNILLAKKIAPKYNAKVIMPCSVTENCPINSGDWCHFSVRLPRIFEHQLIKSGKLSYEDEKFCFVIFAKDSADEFVNSTVVKKPIKKKGHVIFDVCKQGKIERIVVPTKKLEKEISWGDNLEIKQ